MIDLQPIHFLKVGARRLELPTPCTPCKYASQLRHAPIQPGLKSKLRLQI